MVPAVDKSKRAQRVKETRFDRKLLSSKPFSIQLMCIYIVYMYIQRIKTRFAYAFCFVNLPWTPQDINLPNGTADLPSQNYSKNP